MRTLPNLRREPATRTTGRTACVVGRGHTSRELATRLATAGVSVVLVAPAPPDDPPPNVSVHEATSMSTADLSEVVDETMVVAATSPDDSENLLTAQLSRTQFGVDRVVVRLNDPGRATAFDLPDVETVSVPTLLGRAMAGRIRDDEGRE